MANPVVGIDLELRLEKFKADMATLPGIASKEGKAMAAQLGKELRAVEKATKDAARGAKDAAGGVKEFGDRAGATGQNASKLAGFLGLISPQAAEAARSVADLADVGEVAADATKALGLTSVSLGAILGPVAVAAAALGAAYLYLSAESEKANAEMEASAKRATEAQAAYERLNKLQRSVADQLLVATKKATTADLDLRDGIAAVTAEYGPRIAAVQDQIAKQDALTKSSADFIATGKGVGAQIQAASNTQRVAAAEAARLRAELAGLTAEQGKLLQQTVQANILGRDDVKVKGEQARAAAELQKTLTFDEQVADLRQKLAAEESDRQAKLRQEYNDNLIEQQAINERMAIERIATAHEVADAQIAEARRAAEEQRAQEQQQIQSTADLLGATSDAFALAAEEQSKTNKDAAMAMFVASKAAAVAQGIVNTALSISSALTLPPPASFIAAAAAGVSGAVAVGSILAAPPPSFNDTPGVQKMDQRGNVSLASGDYFAAARSPAELQRQVGAAGGGGVSILQVRLGHKVLDQSVARTIQEGGRLSREISRGQKTGTTGHRSRA